MTVGTTVILVRCVVGQVMLGVLLVTGPMDTG